MFRSPLSKSSEPLPPSCSKCKLSTTLKTGFNCAVCDVTSHFACTAIGKVTATNINFLALANIRVLCDSCSEAPASNPVPFSDDRLAGLESAQKSTEEKLSKILDFLQPAQAPDSDDGFKVVGKRRSYASAASKTLPFTGFASVLANTMASALDTKTEHDKRTRAVVIDNLKPASDMTDLQLVSQIFANLGHSGIGIDEVARLGRASDDRPPKLKVIFASNAERDSLLASNFRGSIREDDFIEAYGTIFIGPSLSDDERHRLWLLRRYRDTLNRANHLDDNNAWFVSTRDLKLVKKDGGYVDWRGRHSAFEEEDFGSWADEFEQKIAAEKAAEARKSSAANPKLAPVKPAATKPSGK